MSTNKKLRKLARNPKRFFQDMLLKRKICLPSLKPKKMIGNYKYTVVSAVYNVEKYLDQFFQALVDQRLDFAQNIRVIMVDDGSIDGSADIIRRWQKKYPSNIKYLHKGNGGQASARNFGLDYVETEWVTFIDPDDFVGVEYFMEADDFLEKKKAKEICALACNLIIFYEDKSQFSDTHPLKYKFQKGDALLSLNQMGKHIQLSASTTFFMANVIKEGCIRFDERVKPNFEDAHFLATYFSICGDATVGFSKAAKYYYRKRSDGNSTLDSAWQKEALFDDVLKFGCLGVIDQFIKNGESVPEWAQRTILYHLIWYVRRLVDNPEHVAFLSYEQKINFMNLLRQIFYYIDNSTIINFELAGAWFFHKVGILGLFKRTEPEAQILYIEDFDPNKRLILVRYFTNNVTFEHFSAKNIDLIPVFAKSINHDFLGELFVIERHLWLPIESLENDELFKAMIGNKPSRISYAGTQHGLQAHIGKIIQSFKKKSATNATKHDKWLFMDRISKSDDNAEHLYRFVSKNYPEKDIAFVLSIDSPDFERLKQDGFNLLVYGSNEHRRYLKECTKIVSSHADRHVVDYFGDGSLNSKHFVFLQHGVIKDDLSKWLNTKNRIDIFVTASPKEWGSIASDGNRYKFTKKEVLLTGLPRHDELLRIQAKIAPENLIFIMPTWRAGLLNKGMRISDRAGHPNDLSNSIYIKAWREFMNSELLAKSATEKSYKIIFHPHSEMIPHIKEFKVPEWVEINTDNQSFQKIFSRAKIMITDYSSAAFDFAFLNKPVLYYQFDEADVFNGTHIYQKGYFDYRKDGFGPVCTTQEALLVELEALLQNNGKSEDVYLERMKQFLPLRDGNCCQRVYDAIVALNQPMPSDPAREMGMLLSLARQKAESEHSYAVNTTRWQKILDFASANGDDSLSLEACQALVPLLRQQGHLLAAKTVLSRGEEFAGKLCDAAAAVTFRNEQALLHMLAQEWEMAIFILKKDSSGDISRALAVCYAAITDVAALRKLEDDVLERPLDARLYRALSCAADSQWADVDEVLGEDSESFLLEEYCLKIEASYQQKKLEEANSWLKKSTAIFAKNTLLVLQEAKIFFEERKWAAAIKSLDYAYPEGIVVLPLTYGLIWLEAKFHLSEFSTVLNDGNALDARFPRTNEIMFWCAEAAEALKDWPQAVTYWKNSIKVGGNAHDRYARSLRGAGRGEEALIILRSAFDIKDMDSDALSLRAELTCIEGNYAEAESCLQGLLFRFPEINQQKHLEMLERVRLMNRA